MKISLECSIKGKVKINNLIKVIYGKKEYILIPDKKGWLSSIKIVKQVESPEKYSTEMLPGKGDVKLEIQIHGDREEKLELVRELQELESVLSFDTGGSLKSIAWDKPKEEFIPETEEEKKRVSANQFQFWKDHIEYPSSLDEKIFEDVIKTKERYNSLIVPKAFYKEGINEFTSHRYINAFYNFYFVLEDLYGEGKTRNNDVADGFRKSQDFTEIMEWMIQNLDKDKKHKNNIVKFCNEEGVSYDVGGLIKLLLKVRGNLHHYSSRSSKHLGTPFSHEEFESIAYLTLGLSVHTILRRIVDINQSNNSTK